MNNKSTKKPAKQVNTREQKALEQREKLLEIALGLFAERGFEGSTIKELADRAGVSLGLMYHYFKNKEALLEAAVDKHSFVSRLRQSVAAGDPDKPLPQHLQQIALSFYKLLGDEKDLVQIFLREGPSNKMVQQVWRKTLTRGLSIMVDFLNTQIQNRKLKPHNPEITARALFSTVLIMRITEDTWTSDTTPEATIEDLVDNLLKGIAI
jgi:AcrR family transcriptional regulator